MDFKNSEIGLYLNTEITTDLFKGVDQSDKFIRMDAGAIFGRATLNEEKVNFKTRRFKYVQVKAKYKSQTESVVSRNARFVLYRDRNAHDIWYTLTPCHTG